MRTWAFVFYDNSRPLLLRVLMVLGGELPRAFSATSSTRQCCPHLMGSSEMMRPDADRRLAGLQSIPTAVMAASMKTHSHRPSAFMTLAPALVAGKWIAFREQPLKNISSEQADE